MVLESFLVSCFYKWLTSFPSTTFKKTVFSPLYILASFVQDLIIAAANQALKQIDETNQERINAITGGMKMPF